MAGRTVSARTRRNALTLGARLTEWRKLQDLTAEQVAQRAGISKPTLWKLESGDPGVSLGVLLDVVRALGFTDQLLDAVDPLSTELGRARAGQALPKRIRH
ncbi:MAG: helix-turn-helix transcriptional regulator [Herbiconiux sp.]|nr:helix-turn-helix transcriptional regulator [Herbiconiux sp.]